MQTAPRPIGECLPALTNGTGDPGSNVPSTTLADFTGIDFTRLPKRLDDAMLAACETMSRMALPAVVPPDEEFFAKCMRSLATMPGRAGDETTEALRVKLYHRKLGGYSQAALSYLVETALERHTFLPSISECIAILRDYPEHRFAKAQKSRAWRRAFDERNARMEDAIEALRMDRLSPDAIAALPEGTKRVAEARGVLRLGEDGVWLAAPDRALIAFLSRDTAEQGKTA